MENYRDPEVSVIISTYNRHMFLKDAITSVLNQTYQDYELIIVDDASIDATQKIIAQFQDKRIISIKHSKNFGGPAARNSGIRIARGKYIAFLDDDDQWFDEKLEKQVHKIQGVSPDVGVIYVGSELRRIEDNHLLEDQYPGERGDVHDLLLRGSLFGSVSKALVRKECFDRVGNFDESIKSCQDWDMWLRISKYYHFDYVPEILSKGFVHNDQLSFRFSSIIPGRIRMVKKHQDEFMENPRILCAHYKQIAKLCCFNGEWKEAMTWFKKAMALNPLEIFKITLWCALEYPINLIVVKSKYVK